MRKVIIPIFGLVVTACGGGGGGGSNVTPTDPNKSFSTAQLESTTLGTVYSSNLTASDSGGLNYTGSLSLANRAQIMLNGVLVTPRDSIFTLSDGTFSITLTGTLFTDTNGNYISFVNQTTGVTCAPVSPDKLPSAVKIGDFGILSTEVCDDNTTTERNWRVEDAGNGNVNIVESDASKNNLNAIIEVTEETDTIDGNGKVIGVKLVDTTTATNYTLTILSV